MWLVLTWICSIVAVENILSSTDEYGARIKGEEGVQDMSISEVWECKKKIEGKIR